jgi:hypothetical protein
LNSFERTRDKTDLDVIRDEMKFVWDDDDDGNSDTWYCLRLNLFLFLNFELFSKGGKDWQKSIMTNCLKNIVFVI